MQDVSEKNVFFCILKNKPMIFTPSETIIFDTYDYREIERPNFPEKILGIEKKIRAYLSETLPLQTAHHHDIPPICVNVDDTEPENLNLERHMPTLMKNFMVTSLMGRTKRMMQIIDDELIQGRDADQQEVIIGSEHILSDGTLSMEVFEHPECLDSEFSKKLEEARKRYFEFFGSIGLMLQPFHPQQPCRNIEGIPPTLSLRRMHPGDRIFLPTTQERTLHGSLFGQTTLN